MDRAVWVKRKFARSWRSLQIRGTLPRDPAIDTEEPSGATTESVYTVLPRAVVWVQKRKLVEFSKMIVKATEKFWETRLSDLNHL